MKHRRITGGICGLRDISITRDGREELYEMRGNRIAALLIFRIPERRFTQQNLVRVSGLFGLDFNSLSGFDARDLEEMRDDP